MLKGTPSVPRDNAAAHQDDALRAACFLDSGDWSTDGPFRAALDHDDPTKFRFSLSSRFTGSFHFRGFVASV